MADYTADPSVNLRTSEAGEGATVGQYKMIGVRTADGIWISWLVQNTPDFTGAYAPQPVTVATVSVSK